MPSTESKGQANRRSTGLARYRHPTLWARGSIILADMLSSALCALPLLLGYSIASDLWAQATGAPSDFVEQGFLLESVVLTLVLIALALLPAVLANILLGARAAWAVGFRVLVAGVLIACGFVALLVWPELGDSLSSVVRR